MGSNASEDNAHHAEMTQLVRIVHDIIRGDLVTRTGHVLRYHFRISGNVLSHVRSNDARPLVIERPGSGPDDNLNRLSLVEGLLRL